MSIDAVGWVTLTRRYPTCNKFCPSSFTSSVNQSCSWWRAICQL